MLKKYEYPGYHTKAGSVLWPNDIVLLFLKTPFFSYALVRPAVLPDSADDIVEDNQLCDIVQ